MPHEPYISVIPYLVLQIPTRLGCRSANISYPFISLLHFLPTILPFTNQYGIGRKGPGQTG